MIMDQVFNYFFLQTIYKAWKLNFNGSLDVVKLSWKLKLLSSLSISVKYKRMKAVYNIIMGFLGYFYSAVFTFSF